PARAPATRARCRGEGGGRMRPEPERGVDVFAPGGLEELVARAERDAQASAELDLVADLVAASELARGALVARPAPRLAGERPAQLARSWWLAAAASILFVVALSLWFARHAGPAPLHELAERGAPRYVEADLRGNEEPEYLPFPQAMTRYTAGDYAGA